MLKTKLLLALVVVVAAVGGYTLLHKNSSAPAKNNTTKAQTPTGTTKSSNQTAVNYCANNTADKAVVISISKQHMWDCAGTKSVYDNAVITGMEMYPADLTPTGTYKIYAKSTNQTLSGSDNTGSWNDPVSYWMPFLDNQYGTYGFHDATWRSDADFGHVDINAPFTTTAKSGSHGCVEMPLAAAKYLYNWAVVGTEVDIQS